MTGRNELRVCLALAALALAIAALSFFLGPSHLGARALLQGLWDGDGMAGVIARDIRLPRTGLALVVGAALGASGAALQGLFRNPLASPDVTGVTSCAGLGAVIALYFGFAAAAPAMLPLFAMIGAFVSTGVLFVLSRIGAGKVALVLAGVAVSSLAVALTALALSFAANPYAMSEMVLWMMGSLKDRTLSDLGMAAPWVAVGILFLLSTGRGLDALTLGDEAAASLGIDVRSVTMRVIIGVALATGAATAVAGAVGFVGLVVPHLIRPFTDQRPSRLILPSALGGALLVAAADVLVRSIDPGEQLRLGVVTAMLGAPFFFWLILRLSRQA